jgi:ribonuclease R
VTIDGETARDFDDAISVEEHGRGGFRLGVHIADVSHYVAEGSRLDAEAFRRGTSVYFPERAVPMLPEALSNGLCSLRPNVPRLAVSAFLDIDRAGEVLARSFAPTVIESARRMTYTEVRRLLEEPRPSDAEEYGPILPMLRRGEALREVLYERRQAAGSLDLDLPEAFLELDDGGRVTDVRPAERNVAHRLIEELMIAANRAVAAELDAHEKPALHRLHAPPELDTLEELRAALAAIGLSFPSSREALDPQAFQAVLRAAHGGPHEALVSSLVLRSLQRAVYAPTQGGHFALSLRHYTHFTSPIRRYPDLLVHRQLKRHLAGEEPSPGLAERLPMIADECSRTERRAEAAERELEKWKKVRFLEDRVGETFQATITGVQPFGFFAQLDRYLVDGLVAIRTLTDDYYHFEADRLRLVGENDGRVFRLGDPLDVVLVKVDEATRNLDFEVPGMPPPRRSSPARRPDSVY